MPAVLKRPHPLAVEAARPHQQGAERPAANPDVATAPGTTYEADPVLGIVKSIGLTHGLEQGLSYYVGVLSATILFIATNAG